MNRLGVQHRGHDVAPDGWLGGEVERAGGTPRDRWSRAGGAAVRCLHDAPVMTMRISGRSRGHGKHRVRSRLQVDSATFHDDERGGTRGCPGQDQNGPPQGLRDHDATLHLQSGTGDRPCTTGDTHHVIPLYWRAPAIPSPSWRETLPSPLGSSKLTFTR